MAKLLEHPVTRRLLDHVYPERCVSCGRFGALLCGRCERRMVIIRPGADRCPNCSAKSEERPFCSFCRLWGMEIDGGAAVTDWTGPGRALTLALKTAGVRDVAAVMAGFMRTLGGRVPCDAAIAVPIHTSRLRERGFNQAEALLDALGWTRAEGRLVRVRKTKHQVDLDAGERHTNVRDAFRWDGPPLAGRRLLLVDDVITTGATVLECARELKSHGAREVRVAAFCRATPAQSRTDTDV